MSTVSPQFGTLVTGLVLARMVRPDSLAAFAVTVVALLVVRSVSGVGTSQLIARWPGDPGEIAPTAMTISVVSAVLICAGLYAAAPALTAAASVPAAARAVRLLSLTAVSCGVAAAPQGMLARRAPGSGAVIDQIGNWLSVAVTIWLVMSGFGVMSLAVGATGGSLVSAALYVVRMPRSLRIGFNPGQACVVLRRTAPLAASGVLGCAITVADLVVVDRVLHVRMLGLYMLALCCACWPAGMLSEPVRHIAPDAVARFRKSPKLAQSVFTASARLLASLTLPACILTVCFATPLISVFYGAGWAQAAAALVWLAPLAVVRAFYDVAADYVTVLTSRRPVIFELIWLVALVPALVAGAKLHGIAGVALAEAAVAVLMVSAWYLIRLRRIIAWAAPHAGWLRIPLAIEACLIAFGALRAAHDNGTGLAFGGAITLSIMIFLIYRMRTVLGAVRRTAASAASVAARPWHVVDGLEPALSSVSQPLSYPVLAPVPSPPVAGGPRHATAQPAPGLADKVHAGARWSMINAIVLRVSGSALSIVLARTVFDPQVWGLYAVSQVVLVLFLTVNQLGICAAIIRWEEDVRALARTVLTISVAMSTLLYAVLYVAAPTIARVLGSPGATGVIRVLCVCVVIDGFASVPMTLLQREFAQRRQMIIDSLNFLVSTGVMLPLAVTGHGAMSFAWGGVAGCTVATILYNVLAPGVLPGWKTSDARRLLPYGLPLAGATLLMMGVTNVDTAIVGATLGPVMLGFYTLAFNISSWPLTVISQAATRVSFAGFSRVADLRERLESAFARALAVLMALAIPACVLLGTLAGPLIHAVYGPRWMHAASALSFLAVLGLLRVAFQLASDCLTAAGKRHQLMWINALWVASLIPVLLAGARLDGIVGVSAGHIIIAVCVVGPAMLWALSRAGISVLAIGRACLRPFIGGLLMAAACAAVAHVARHGLISVAAATVAGLALYVPVVFPMRVLVLRPRSNEMPASLNEASAA